MVVTDYYSFYPEVVTLQSTSASAVVSATKSVFARHGIPDVCVSDNGPQYSSQEYRVFAEDWGFTHNTSSPHMPSSNGMAEAAVKTVKILSEKQRILEVISTNRYCPTEQHL